MTVIDEAPDPKATLLSSLLRHEVHPSHILFIAYSGGSDSAALLAAACELRDEKHSPYYGLPLVALYLDHGIRGEVERAEEVSIVRNTCRRLGVPLTTKHLEPGVLRQNSGQNGLEAAAREARHSFFAESVRTSSSNLIVTAHHLEDQLETLLLRFLRGAGPGAAGMRELRQMNEFRILRPWLTLPKEAVATYAKLRRLAYVTDSSNTDTAFARNRVRHRLMPVLDELFPEYRSTLPAADERVQKVAEFLRNESEYRITWTPHGRGWCARRDEFYGAPDVVRTESLKLLCIQMGEVGSSAGQSLPTSGFFSQTAGEDDGRPVGVVVAGGGWRLERYHDLILWGRDVVQTAKIGYVLRVRENMRVVLGHGDRTVVSIPESGQAVPGCALQLDAATIAAPLLLRTRRPGDSIRTRAGSKSVKKILSEWRIPADLREDIPVLEDRKGVCAVVGQPFGYPNLVSTRCSPRRMERELRAACSPAETSIFRLWVTADGVENEYAK